jgi:hypothetical protein
MVDAVRVKLVEVGEVLWWSLAVLGLVVVLKLNQWLMLILRPTLMLMPVSVMDSTLGPSLNFVLFLFLFLFLDLDLRAHAAGSYGKGPFCRN